MPKKKLKIYAITMGILLLALTFSAVRRQRIRRGSVRRPVATAAPKADLDFLENTAPHLSEVRLEKIQPLLGGKSPQKGPQFERDPFWPVVHAARREPVFYKKSRRKGKGPVFRLEGIISRGRAKKAIVNGKVVRVGNRVGSSFRVKLITNNMVVLIGPTREIYLHF